MAEVFMMVSADRQNVLIGSQGSEAGAGAIAGNVGLEGR